MAEDDDIYQARGKLGLLTLGVPVVSITATGIAYAVLFWYGNAGRPATGPLIRLDFDACPDARPFVLARAEEMGLPELKVDDREGGFSLTLRAPEQDRVRETLPRTLSTTGRFEVRPFAFSDDNDGEVLIDHAAIESATAYLPFLDAPKVYIQLDKAGSRKLLDHMTTHPDDGVGYWIDDQRVTTRKNMPPEQRGGLTLDLTGRTDMERMDFAASSAIILQHGPLPCPVTPVGSPTVVDEAR